MKQTGNQKIMVSKTVDDPNDLLRKKSLKIVLSVVVLMPFLFIYLKYLHVTPQVVNEPDISVPSGIVPSSIPAEMKVAQVGTKRDASFAELIPVHCDGGTVILSKDGQKAFVVASNREGISTVDISNPGSVREVAYYDHARTANYPDPKKVYADQMDAVLSLDGEVLFVLDWNLGLYAMHIGVGGDLRVVDHLKLFGSSKITLASDGTRAYLSGQNGLYVINVENPKRLQLAGHYDENGYRSKMSPPRFIYTGDIAEVRPGTLYLLKGSGGIDVFDVRSETRPRKIGTYSTLGRGIKMEVAKNGERLYIIGGESGMEIVDIADPLQPKPLGGYLDDQRIFDIALSELGSSRAYLNAGEEIEVVDVHYPYDPKLLYRVKMPKEKSIRGITLLKEGRYIMQTGWYNVATARTSEVAK